MTAARIAGLAVALATVLPPAAFGATIQDASDRLACVELATQRRIDSLVGDSEAVVKLINLALAARQCFELPVGLKVRIEENSFPYACVRKLGSVTPCVWIKQAAVDVRE